MTNAITGVALSNFTHDSGPMTGYGTGTECDNGCSGTIAAQQYLNTTIVLEDADPDFSSTLGVSGGTTYSGLTSEEGGKIWKIAQIDIPAMV